MKNKISHNQADMHRQQAGWTSLRSAAKGALPRLSGEIWGSAFPIAVVQIAWINFCLRHEADIRCAEKPTYLATAPYCWKQANLWGVRHFSRMYCDHKVVFLLVCPSIAWDTVSELTVHVQPSHVKKFWAVVPSEFVLDQNCCHPRDWPVESMLIGCRMDPSVRSV